MMNLLDKLYRRSEGLFIGVWIAAYVILSSYSDAASKVVGVQNSIMLGVHVVMGVLLWLWVRHANMGDRYRIVAPAAPASRLLFYIPAIVVATKKTVFGFAPQVSALECALWVLDSVLVGYLEEMLFRGLLFQGMLPGGRTKAIVVSSVTFGIGHIVNLFNASGQGLVVTLGQIAFAVSVGFMLVLMLLKSGSIWPCIVFHGLNNALSTFENEAYQIALFGSEGMAVLVTLGISLAIVVPYCLYLLRLPDAMEG